MGFVKPFTRDEREKIVQFLIQQKSYASVRGNKIWQLMEEKKITDRTWQSMKDDFKKKIIMELHTYGIPENDVILMRRGMMQDSWKEKSEYVSTYHAAKKVMSPTHDYTLRKPIQIDDDIIVISDDEVEFNANKELTINETVKTREKRITTVHLLNKSVACRLSRYREICGINDSEYFSPESSNATQSQESDSGDINKQTHTNMQQKFADGETECSPIAPQIENIEKTENDSKQFVPHKRYAEEAFLTSSQDHLNEEHCAFKQPKKLKRAIKVKRNLNKNLFSKNESNKDIVTQEEEIVNTSSKSSSSSREVNKNEQQNCKDGGHFSRKETLENVAHVSIQENYHNDCITSNKIVEDSKENGENNRSISNNEENVSSKTVIDACGNKLVVESSSSSHEENKDERQTCKDGGDTRKETLENVVPVSVWENIHNYSIPSNKIVADPKSILLEHMTKQKSENCGQITLKNPSDPFVIIIHDSDSESDMFESPEKNVTNSRGNCESLLSAEEQEKLLLKYFSSNNLYDKKEDIFVYQEFHKLHPNTFTPDELKNKFVHKINRKVDKKIRYQRRNQYEIFRESNGIKCQFLTMNLCNELYLFVEKCVNVEKDVEKLIEILKITFKNTYIVNEDFFSRIRWINDMRNDGMSEDLSNFYSSNNMRNNNMLQYSINVDSFMDNSNLIQIHLQHALDEIDNIETEYSFNDNLILLLNNWHHLADKIENTNNEYSDSFVENINLLHKKMQNFFDEIKNTNDRSLYSCMTDYLNLLQNSVQYLLDEIENNENIHQSANNTQVINYETSRTVQNDSFNSIGVVNSDNAELESSENYEAITSQDADRTLKLQQLRNDIEFVLTQPISNNDTINIGYIPNDFSNITNLGNDDTSISELNISLMKDSDNSMINLIVNESKHLVENPIPEDISACKYKYEESLDIFNTTTKSLNEAEKKCCLSTKCNCSDNSMINLIVNETKHLVENPIPEDISSCKYKYEESLGIFNTTTKSLNEAEKNCWSYRQRQSGKETGICLSTKYSCSSQTEIKQIIVDQSTKQLNNSQIQENVPNETKSSVLPKNFQDLQTSIVSSDHNNIERSSQVTVAEPLSLNLSENNSNQILANKSFNNNNTMYILSSYESVSENTEDLKTEILQPKNTQQSQELFSPENSNPPASQETVYSENFIPLTFSTPKPQNSEEETLSSFNCSETSKEISIQPNLKVSLLNTTLENANDSNVSSLTEILTQIEQKLHETDSDADDTLLDLLTTEEVKLDLKEENATAKTWEEQTNANEDVLTIEEVKLELEGGKEENVEGKLQEEQTSKIYLTQEEHFLTCGSQFYTCEDDTL